jgi:hypothetical protein
MADDTTPDVRDAQLAVARAALRRLSLIDEMAGMGQRDGDPELTARCKHAAGALAAMGRLGADPEGPLLDLVLMPGSLDSTFTEYAVAMGGADPNDCARIEIYDDEADAAENVQWYRDSYVARRTVTRSRWERVDAEPVTDGAQSDPGAAGGLVPLSQDPGSLSGALSPAKDQP